MGDLVFNGGASSYFFGGCTWSNMVSLQENMACGSATNSELAELTFSEHRFLILELGSQSAMSPSMELKLEYSVTGTGVCTPDEAVISFFYSNPPPQAGHSKGSPSTIARSLFYFYRARIHIKLSYNRLLLTLRPED